MVPVTAKAPSYWERFAEPSAAGADNVTANTANNAIDLLN